MKGKFIAFEGIDGSGKSTQIKALKHYLESRGEKVYVTREPTDSPIGALVHSCMTGRVETDDETIALLCAADRVDHLYNAANGIIERLEERYTVITDRYLVSSYAYQGAQLDMEWIIEINKRASEALKPDLTIYIDIDPTISFGRIEGRRNRERYEELQTLKRVRNKYFEAFEKLGNEHKIAIIKSEERPEDTATRIREEADKLFTD